MEVNGINEFNDLDSRANTFGNTVLLIRSTAASIPLFFFSIKQIYHEGVTFAGVAFLSFMIL